MTTPFYDKLRRWRDSSKGIKTLRSADLNPPLPKRGDIPDVQVSEKVSRGDRAQRARLKYYPSIDVDYEDLYAGYIEGSVEDADEYLFELGYRNNPTAYVEVTEEHGPDDGSYARQYITEEASDIDREYLTNFPSLLRRVKNQVHVCIWEVGDRVYFLAHDEKSAWLQPMLHLTVVGSDARIGVRDFRSDWYDEFGEELPGREDVKWETAH